MMSSVLCGCVCVCTCGLSALLGIYLLRSGLWISPDSRELVQTWERLQRNVLRWSKTFNLFGTCLSVAIEAMWRSCIRNPGGLKSCIWCKPSSRQPKRGFNLWIPVLRRHIFDSGRDTRCVSDVTEKQTVQSLKMPQKWTRIRWFSLSRSESDFPRFSEIHLSVAPFSLPLPATTSVFLTNHCVLFTHTSEPLSMWRTNKGMSMSAPTVRQPIIMSGRWDWSKEKGQRLGNSRREIASSVNTFVYCRKGQSSSHQCQHQFVMLWWTVHMLITWREINGNGMMMMEMKCGTLQTLFPSHFHFQ